MKRFFSKHKKKFIPLLSLLLVAVLFIFPKFVLADSGAVATVVGWILSPIIALFGKLVVLLLDILVSIAQYNGFIGSTAVSYGWVVVRDLCNMFFVLILLIIAFASILRIDSYNLKTWLPKLIIMAVLINFSKMICGVLIDFTQIVMLTFINAVKDIAGGNLTEMLGINKILTASPDGEGGEITKSSIVGSLILALIMVIIATVVILSMLVMLAMRIIMIWIYVVLSPLAYLLASFPQGTQYSQRWWSDFSKNLIIGPVVAFFLWLSFASLGSVEGSAQIKSQMMSNTNVEGQDLGGDANESAVAATMTQAGSKENMIVFIISIGMLLGGLMIANEIGGIAGKAMGKAVGKMQSIGTGALKMTGKGLKRATGIERAQNAYKAYKQGREAKRQNLAQKDAKLIAKAEGGIKKTATAPFNAAGKAIGQFVKSRMAGDISQKTIDNTRQQIEREKNQKMELEELRVRIENFENDPGVTRIREKENEMNSIRNRFERGDITQDVAEEELRNINNRYDNDEEYVRATEKEPMYRDQRRSFAEAYENITGRNVSTVSTSDIDRDIRTRDNNIETGGEELKSKMEQSRKFDKVANVVGQITTLGLKNKIKHAGEEDLSIASNFRNSEISRHKEEMKYDDEETLRKKMNDYSLAPAARNAASMVLMDQGKLTDEEAEFKRDEISSAYRNDGKASNQLDSSLAGSYFALTREMENLKDIPERIARLQREERRTSDPNLAQNYHNQIIELENKREKVDKKIVSGVVNGSIKIEGLDQESLNIVMPRLAETMSPSNFRSMVSRQTVSQQNKITIAVTHAATNPENSAARNQLASLNGTLDPLNRGYEKENYFNNMSQEQIQDLVSSRNGRQSLERFLRETNRYTRLAGQSEDVIREELNRSLRRTFNNSPAHQAIIGEIRRIVNQTT
jgi:hypothetical protein